LRDISRGDIKGLASFTKEEVGKKSNDKKSKFNNLANDIANIKLSKSAKH